MTPTKRAAPSCARGEVDRAGRLLAQGGAADPLVIGRALDAVNDWRSSHSFPLNTFQMTLRTRSASVCNQPIVAQRLKRTPSIIAKLRRFPQMQLSRMQDVGGARAVLASVAEVESLRELYRRPTKHAFVAERNYIRQPKPSGYRGIHLVYRYRGARAEYDGLRIEVQLRSRLQHAWATAVETVGAFLGQALKSSEGEADWLRFFALIGSMFALDEGTPVEPGVPGDRNELMAATRTAAQRLRAKDRLAAFGAALLVSRENEEMRRGDYFLLVIEQIEPDRRSLTIRPYCGHELAAGIGQYQTEEKRLAGTAGDAVLVAADSLDSLRRAFPNYFADTETFVQEMTRLLA